VVFFNYTTMQMTAKIVYYGPGLCGKTTNLQFIHHKTASRSRGEMISLETETDRTLFFDLLPLEVGVIGGMKVRLQLYTVPGQVFYNATRKLVLKGVDGIVFVADSQMAMLDANVESLQNLHANLAELNIVLEQIPLVFQFNKRDIRSIQTVDRLNEVLNPAGVPWFEAAALHGIGVFETLKCVSRQALQTVRRKILDEAKRRPEIAPVAAAVTAPAPAPVAAAPLAAAPVEPVIAPARPEPASDPLASLVTEPPPVTEDIPVEFAEEDTGRHKVRVVPTKGLVDISHELEKLRTITAAPAAARPGAGAGSREVERRLQDILVTDRDSRQEVKRKAAVEVLPELLKASTGLRLHVALDGPGGEHVVADALSVRLVGNRKLERLTLHLEIEVKGKA
jgi:signal recognition particle receptor subunit beta